MVFSEQQLQDYVLGGGNLPERGGVEKKVQEIMNGLEREHLKRIMRVSALLYAYDKTGKFDEIESHKRLMRLLSVARREDESLGDYIHFFNSCLDINTDLWQRCMGRSDINLGRAFLKGGINLPDFNSWKTLIRDGCFDTVMVMPPVPNVTKTIMDRFRGFPVSFKMAAGYQEKPKKPNCYTFAVDTEANAALTYYVLTGTSSEQLSEIKNLSENMAHENPNIELSGLSLDEYMLMILDSYRIHGKLGTEKLIDVNGTDSYLLAEPYGEQNLFLEAGVVRPGEYDFEYTAREGPIGRVKATIKPEGLINGL